MMLRLPVAGLLAGLLFAVSAPFAAPRAAYACMCLAPLVETSFSNADAVFLGTALAEINDAGHVITIFEVERIWKGGPRVAAQVWGSSIGIMTSCDINFHRSWRYAVFAYEIPAGQYVGDRSGVLRASYCGTTRELREVRELGVGLPVQAVRATLAVFGFGR
jgi:hypothetical protein